MTLAHSAGTSVQRARLGTVSLLAWIGDPQTGHDTPFLLLYSLGDGNDGPRGTMEAMAVLIAEAGLTPGELIDATAAGSPSPVRLLIQSGYAVLNLPGVSAQCPAPAEWLDAAALRGHAHLIIGAVPWPQAVPGQPVTEEMLQSYAGHEDVLLAAGHALVTVGRLR
ncbi:DUF5949 family protein [Streptomyces clavuligerus]|uniref:Uncharacterized protein n=1 Tax=Streptomyces clavuligerus TaxID=1901 RepID=B5H1U4_STRCL|nr:DUF5949 family protein [Streptomyces clavuligerus]ANW18405.1 hypothetical protein BB341_09255 [Streptomyces clavuligerus]AXU12960.1 hypothetical protein D1794_09585 [Streptomyces clavuligerus]EDY52540.1 conserved hypothetical protein [Streptomyces clavuligerus]EFG08969.1 Hypothetical protein SCLAV_3895 [Streptomyces clavuligerus]MBY6302888.1 hypothetical protein [Streptomyces clavuligerus]